VTEDAHPYGRPKLRQVVRSTGEAMRLLEERRAWLVRKGRFVAWTIARERGTVTSADVFQAMVRSYYVDADGESPRWLGAVFARSAFEWTGEYRTRRDMERNVHERTTKIWRARAGAKMPEDPGDQPVQRDSRQVALPGIDAS